MNGQMSNVGTIVIGCGGSGIETLTRLNGLLSQDVAVRNELRRSMWYIAIDTDVDQLDGFKQSVQNQMIGAEPPHCELIRLSKGAQSLVPTVANSFLRPFTNPEMSEEQRAGQKRLMEHWWHDKQGRPFDAPRVTPIKDGAGQCPPVSHFLAWKYLQSEVESKLLSTIEDIQIRRAGMGRDGEADGNPLDLLNFVIVAGAAGGTGRGCWELVAFKAREIITEKFGAMPNPVLFLLDASVYRDVYKTRPQQKECMYVNSLTGVSQLSCWMENQHRADRQEVYRYSLPNMANPADERNDVMSVDLTFALNEAPVNNAYLIFNSSTSGATINSSKQAYDLVSKALYGLLTKSRINASVINDPTMPYWGVGSSMFEINATDLRIIFENVARLDVLHNLVAATENDELRAVVETACKNVRSELGLMLELEDGDWAAYQKDPSGSLIQRALFFLEEGLETGLANLAAIIDEDDKEEVQTSVQQLCERNASLVDNAVGRAREDLQLNPAHIQALVTRELTMVFKKTNSVNAMLKMVKMLHADLEAERSVLPVEPRKLNRNEDPQALAEDYAGREYFLVGRAYNEDEKKSLLDATQAAVGLKNYSYVRDHVVQILREACEAVQQLSDRVAQIQDRIIEVERLHRNKVERRIGDLDRLDEYFTDPLYPERALATTYSATRFVSRVLKPVLGGRREVEQLVRKHRVVGDQLSEYMLELLQSPVSYQAESDRELLRRELTSKVASSVHMEDRFLERKFSMEAVVEDLRDVWTKRFQHAQGSDDERAELAQLFETFFGSRPDENGALPTIEDFMVNMAKSLCATCSPFIQIEGNEDTRRSISIFMPKKLGNLEEVQDYLHGQLGGAVIDVIDRVDSMNPFMMFAFTRAGVRDLNRVKNLDYWSEDAGVLEKLKLAEDPSGLTIFPDDGSKATGYSSPIYVRDPLLRELRWNPWIREVDVSKDEKRRNETLDALLYALLVVDENSEVGKKLQKVNWSLPLVLDKGAERYVFTRRASNWSQEGRNPVEHAGCGWDPDTAVATSIWQVFEGLLGDTEKVKARELRAKGTEWRERILLERTVFWNEVAPLVGLVSQSMEYRDLVQAYATKLANVRSQAKKDPNDRSIWDALVARLESAGLAPTP